MSSPIVVPFNFQPAETSIKTSNYTIPAGRYARVSIVTGLGSVAVGPHSSNNATFSRPVGFLRLNNISILTNDFSLTSLNNSSPETFTLNFGSPVDLCGLFSLGVNSYQSNGAASLQVNLTSGGWTNVVSVVIADALSNSLAFNSFNQVNGIRVVKPAGFAAYTLTGSYTKQNNVFNTDFFVPSGSVLTASGVRYLVQEFNQIS